jgi:hypothetical protein
MSSPSRLQIGILVTAATLIVCSLGVRAELKMSEASNVAHRLQSQGAQQPARSVAVARDEQALNTPPL